MDVVKQFITLLLILGVLLILFVRTPKGVLSDIINSTGNAVGGLYKTATGSV